MIFKEGILHLGSYVSPSHPAIGLLIIIGFIIFIYLLYIRYRKPIKYKIKHKPKKYKYEI